MRASIPNGFENIEKLPWTTTAEYLQSLVDDVFPKYLRRS